MKDTRRIKQNNRGITLVELIVVILIISIASGGAVIGVSVLYNARVDNAAKRLETMFKRARETAMENANADEARTSLVIFKEDGDMYGKIMVGDSEIEREKLGNGSVSVRVLYGDASESEPWRNRTQIEVQGHFDIAFNPSSGGVMEFEAGGAKKKLTDIWVCGSEDIKYIVIPENGRIYKAQ